MSIRWTAAERFCSYIRPVCHVFLPVADLLTSSLWLRICIFLVHSRRSDIMSQGHMRANSVIQFFVVAAVLPSPRERAGNEATVANVVEMLCELHLRGDEVCLERIGPVARHVR